MTWNFSNITGGHNDSQLISENGGNVYVYKVPDRGVLSSVNLRTSLNTLSSNILSQWNTWRTYIKPILNSLPAGSNDSRWKLDSKTNAFLYGVQGATLLVNNDATVTSSNGKYWDSDKERPKTIAESLEDLWDKIGILESTGIGAATAEEVDLTGYAYLPGVSGGQVLYGGTDSGDDLSLFSTSNATKGSIYVGSTNAVFDGTGKLTITNDDAFTPVSPYNGSIVLSGDNSSIVSTSANGLLLLGDSGAGIIALSEEAGVTGYDCSAVYLNALKISGSDDPYVYITADASYGAEDGDATIDIESSLTFGVVGTASVNIEARNNGSNAASDSLVYIRSNSSGVVYSGDSQIQLVAERTDDDGNTSSYIYIGHEDIRFRDQNKVGSTYSLSDMKFSEDSSEWTAFKTNFGEVSLLNAISQAAGVNPSVIVLPESSTPSSAADVGKVYSKDVTGATELFYLDDSGNEVQITSGGAVNAGGGGISDWGYLDTVGPSDGLGGNVAPLVCYQFDNIGLHLNDRMGTGNNFSIGGSSTIETNEYLSQFMSTKAVSSNGGISDLNILSTSESLRITGAITVEWVGRFKSFYSGSSGITFLSCSASGESYETNTLYSLRIQNDYGQLGMFNEYESDGSGDIDVDFNCYVSLDTPQYIVMTRASDGVTYKIYINGEHLVTHIATHVVEKAGSGNLQILKTIQAGTNACCSSLRITAEEFTSTQVAEVWDSIKPAIAS